MLDDFQSRRLWENLLAAETRSLYFADLASLYTRRKQWMNGATFFLSSGAAATIVSKAPAWVPTLLATVAALQSAYTIAFGLDRKIATLVKLHSAWSQIAADYERLWSAQDADDATDRFDEILRREREPSELATTEAPNDPERIGKWQDQVTARYNQAVAPHAG